MPASLDELGLRFGTDKASHFHDYLNFYETFMAPLRDAPITLLEIGVHQGASLQVWKEYFQNAKIVGVDILPGAKIYESERVHVELADQSNLEHLARLAAQHGPFDIVVEDGSHMWEHQITSLRALFPFVKNGGYYVVEDLQTNYGAFADKYRGVSSHSCVAFLKRWMDFVVGDDLLDLESVEDAFLRTYGRSVGFMSFHRRACVIRKSVPETGPRVTRRRPEIPAPDNALPVGLMAHVGMRGDVFGPEGFVDEGSDLFTFQGFSLHTEIGALEYRTRGADGAWSEWFGEGGFAGTRGLSRALFGASVRVAERLADRYAVETHGVFVGGQTGYAHDGEDCVAADGAALRGLQVVLRPKAEPAPGESVAQEAGSGEDAAGVGEAVGAGE